MTSRRNSIDAEWDIFITNAIGGTDAFIHQLKLKPNLVR